MGAHLVKEVATKTNDLAGDGTTTATVLAQALVHEGLRNVAAGASPMSLTKGIAAADTAAVESIAEHANATDDKCEIPQVPAITAAHPIIGELVPDALEQVGKAAVATEPELNPLR